MADYVIFDNVAEFQRERNTVGEANAGFDLALQLGFIVARADCKAPPRPHRNCPEGGLYFEECHRTPGKD